MRLFLLAALVGCCNVSIAGILDIRVEPTPGLAGFSTYTLSMTPQGGEVFRAIDASVLGPVNQANPLGTPTVFSDSNSIFPSFGFDPKQDTQFLFTSSQVLSIPQLTRESSSELRGVLAGIQRLGTTGPIDFAQIVTDQPDLVELDFDVDFTGITPSRFGGSLSACLVNGCADTNNPDPTDPTDPTDPVDPNPTNPIPQGPFDPGPPRVKPHLQIENTPGMPGYWTHTLFLQMDPGATLRGVDATFFGPMNQVNPAGNGTVFTDANVFFPFVGADPRQDSQFLVPSSSVLTIGAAESDTLLRAAISGLADNGLPNPAPIARLVTPILGNVDFYLAIDTGASQPTIIRSSLNDFLIPEPASAVLSIVLCIGCASRRCQHWS